MNKLLLFMACVSVCLFSTVQAHNGVATIDDLELGQSFNLVHDDVDEGDGFKGTFTLTVTNTGTEAWGDFHFEIINGFGGDAWSVLFTDFSMGGLNPTSSQSGLSWVINNPFEELSTLDLYFYGDPVNPGDTATFTVYTDNTAQELSWFGMSVYPTPVPEPATLSILALGGLALLRRKRS